MMGMKPSPTRRMISSIEPGSTPSYRRTTAYMGSASFPAGLGPECEEAPYGPFGPSGASPVLSPFGESLYSFCHRHTETQLLDRCAAASQCVKRGNFAMRDSHHCTPAAVLDRRWLRAYCAPCLTGLAPRLGARARPHRSSPTQ